MMFHGVSVIAVRFFTTSGEFTAGPFIVDSQPGFYVVMEVVA